MLGVILVLALFSGGLAVRKGDTVLKAVDIKWNVGVDVATSEQYAGLKVTSEPNFNYCPVKDPSDVKVKSVLAVLGSMSYSSMTMLVTLSNKKAGLAFAQDKSTSYGWNSNKMVQLSD